MNNKVIPVFFLFFSFLTYHVFLLATGSHSPLIYGDESGYIGNTRHLLFGHPPKSTYSPGYSYTLIPIFLLTNDISIAYKLIQLWNSIILSFVPTLLFYLISFIDHTTDIQKRIACSIFVSLYPSFLLVSNFAMSESLFIFLFLFLTFQIAHFSSNPFNKILWLTIPITYAYLFLTHPRAIAVFPVLLATGILVFYPVIQRRFGKQATKQVMLSIIMLAGGICLAAVLALLAAEKNYNVSKKFITFFTADGFFAVISTYVAQLYYLCMSTYGLILFGIYWSFHYIWGIFRGRKWNDRVFPIIFFITASMMMAILISAWFMKNGDRGDHILYGRYNEGFLAPMLLLGVLSFLDIRSLKRYCLWVVLGFVSIFIVVYITKAGMLNQRSYNLANIFGIYHYNLFFNNFDLARVSLVFGIFILSYLTISIYFRKISVIIICIFFCFTTLLANHFYFNRGWKTRTKSLEISSIINQVHQKNLVTTDNIQVFFDQTNFFGDFWYKHDLIIRNPNIRIANFDPKSPGVNDMDSALIVSQGYAFKSDFPKARIVSLENNTPLCLWVTPGPLQDYFIQTGQVLPPDFPGPLDREAFSASIETDLPKNSVWNNSKNVSFRATVTHTGTGSFWPSVACMMDITHSVRLGTRIFDTNNPAYPVFETRSDFPRSVYPGKSESVDVLIPSWILKQLNGKYWLALEMVQEFTAWFPEKNDGGLYFLLEAGIQGIQVSPISDRRPNLPYRFDFVSPGMLIPCNKRVVDPLHQFYTYNLFNFLGNWTEAGHGQIKNIHLEIPPEGSYLLLETMENPHSESMQNLHLHIILNNRYRLEPARSHGNQYFFDLPSINHIESIDIFSELFSPIRQSPAPRFLGISADSNIRLSHELLSFFRKMGVDLDANTYGIELKAIRIISKSDLPIQSPM